MCHQFGCHPENLNSIASNVAETSIATFFYAVETECEDFGYVVEARCEDFAQGKHCFFWSLSLSISQLFLILMSDPSETKGENTYTNRMFETVPVSGK